MTQQLTYFKAVKLLLPILLTASLLAQDKSNQNSYAIETTSQYYHNVSIDSVYGLRVELYDRILKTKLDIPIAEIKSLKQNGLRPNTLVTIIGTVGGGFGGAIAGLMIDFGFYGFGRSNEGSLIIIGGIGGGAMLGYKLGSNILSGYKVEEFEGWTLDKKRNHLNSKIDQ